MKPRTLRMLALVVATTTLSAPNAHAFRMIQNTATGRMSSGAAVTCDNSLGFTHWTTSAITYRLNPANQGAGAATAVQSAMAAWTNVAPASFSLVYGGTTSAAFVTDGVNSLSWGTGNGCSGGCLALTALVLVAGQVIAETDVTFNNAAAWSSSGGSYDVQSVATHELGHTLGIHHTEITKQRNRPTMYANYFGTDMRTLETDDVNALNCAYNRYVPANLVASVATPSASGRENRGVQLAARPRPGGSILHFAVASATPVRLDVFDVAGRKLATLVDDFVPAGDHEIAWDGRSNSGRVHSGFYFARILTGEGRTTATVPLAE